jgi:hypothetical protein
MWKGLNLRTNVVRAYIRKDSLNRRIKTSAQVVCGITQKKDHFQFPYSKVEDYQQNLENISKQTTDTARSGNTKVSLSLVIRTCYFRC